jgi:hypothetical protein
MNPVEIVNNKIYQNAFIENFVFDGGFFLVNEPSQKKEFLFETSNCEISKTHDQIIKDAYLFYKFDMGALMLLYTPSKEEYSGTVIYIDSESSIHPLGDNPFNSTTEFSRSMVETHSINSIEDFMSSCEAGFGGFTKEIDEDVVESKLYDEYNEFE